MTARDDVLGRIRAALAGDGAPSATDAAVGGPADGGYRRHGELAGAALLELLAERLADYRALVRQASRDTLAAQVSQALGERGVGRLVVPAGLGVPLPEFVTATVDDGLTAAELDSFDGVVTTATVAIAETGSIVLDGSAGQGRRAISLVPDYHLCIVEAAQVVQLVPEAVERLAGAATRPLTWISGPSATSDIELERVEGVHGPRTLEVVIVGAATGLTVSPAG